MNEKIGACLALPDFSLVAGLRGACIFKLDCGLNCKRIGKGKPPTFDFLGLTQYCSKEGRLKENRYRTIIKLVKNFVVTYVHGII